MKFLFLLLACLFVSVAVAQQDSTTNKQKPVIPASKSYCVVLKKGKPEVKTDDGKTLPADVNLKNGNMITASGTVVRPDGTIRVIKPGSCVNREGNEVEMAVKKN